MPESATNPHTANGAAAKLSALASHYAPGQERPLGSYAILAGAYSTGLAGSLVALRARDKAEVQAFNHLDKGSTYPVDETLQDADPESYDALVLPGGVANPDQLRTDERAIQFVQRIFSAGKPVGVICHRPWTLVEADLLRDRKLTSWPSLRTDIRNAGGEWVDEEVVVDQGLVSSRKPDDLPAFCAKIVEEFAEGRHEVAHPGATPRARSRV